MFVEITLNTYFSLWDSYINGWEFLINNGDQLLWNLLIIVAFIVRALSVISLLYYSGLRLFWDKKEATKGIIISVLVFIFVTLPFALGGIPILWPSLLPLDDLLIGS